jgi:hypothetical protein
MRTLRPALTPAARCRPSSAAALPGNRCRQTLFYQCSDNAGTGRHVQSFRVDLFRPEEHGDMAINKTMGTAALACAGLAGLLMMSAPTRAADVDVGVSIGISQPGVYGRIDIGRFPQPQVIVQQPVIIARPVRAPEPVYLWVPPGHQKNWRKHCGRYNACGVPVYFVQERWYRDQVMRPAPRPGERRGDDRGRDKGHDKGHDKHGDRGHGRGNGGRD